MLDVEAINNPLDILSYVCSNLCSKIKISNKHSTIKSEPEKDTKELLLYCHESLDSFFDEDDDARDARKRRNYLLEREYKLVSKSPTQTTGFIPTSQLPTQTRDKKRKCLREFDNDADEPSRKMTRHNRGNLYKQLREEIVH